MTKTEPKTQGIARIASIDIFRGLVILVMIFVNDVSGVRGLPWWTYHMREGVNGMTYVDMVFPFFLFILGMAIPLATERRLEKGDTPSKLSLHIVLRSLGLVVLGITLANAGSVSAELTGIPEDAWALLALAGVFLGWNVYPRTGRTILYRIMKYAGFALLATMLLLFRRRTEQGGAAWLDFGYWEILGLLGCTYFAVAFLYLAFRSKPRLFPVLLAGLRRPQRVLDSGLDAVDSTMARASPHSREPVLGEHGWRGGVAAVLRSHAAASAQGARGRYLRGDSSRRRLADLAPRNFEEPWHAGVVPVFGWRGRAAVPGALLGSRCEGLESLGGLRSPGRSEHVDYVPAAGRLVFRSILHALTRPWSAGLPGVVRSFVFTGVILALAAVLTRAKVRLQL